MKSVKERTIESEYRLGNEQAAEDVRLNIEGTTNLLMKGQA